MGAKKRFSTKRKSTIELSLISLFLIILLATIVSADAPFPYNQDPSLPLEQNFDPKSNFRTDLFTGSATYNYNFKLPPGTNELAPRISLNYNHNLRTSRPGIVGSGWTLTENYIQRDVNFTRDDDTDDEFKLFFNGQSYELLKDEGSNRYHTKLESFLHIEHIETGGNNTNSTYWVVKTTDGTQYQFGFYEHSERIATENNLAWRWSLDLIKDTHKNSIFYNYEEDPFGDNGTVYLVNISYNNDKKRTIDFVYEDSNRPDIWKIYDNGNLFKELRRLKEINIHADSKFVRRYELAYSYAQNLTGYSFLSNITEYGTNKIVFKPVRGFLPKWRSASFITYSEGNKKVKYMVYRKMDGDRKPRAYRVNESGEEVELKYYF